MKTLILQLEPHDDAISTRDKMGWGQTGRVLLVWPQRGRILNRRLDLVLLQRHSQSIGVQLALVTRNPQVRFNARRLAIPVFRSLSQAQQKPWRVGRRRPQRLILEPDRTPRLLPELLALRQQAQPVPAAWMTHPVTRLALFTFGVLALLAIAAVLWPSAVIRLAPQSDTQVIALEVQASPDSSTVDLSGRLPALPVSIIVEGRDRIASSRTIRIPDQTASGFALFTNLTDREVSLPEGTIVRTLDAEPARYSTTRAGQVAAGPGQTLTLPVRALQPGKTGNRPARRIVTVEGPLGLSLTVTNLDPIRGGTDRSSPAPGSQDYARLKDQLQEALSQTAWEEITQKVSGAGLLLTTEPVLVRVVEEVYRPAEVQPADWLELSLRLEFQAHYVTDTDLQALVAGVLDANLPDGYLAVPNTLEIEHLSYPDSRRPGPTRWRLLARREIQGQLSENQVIALGLGLPPTAAQSRLSRAFPLDSPAEIRLTPDWWPRLPVVPFRIQVLIG